VSLSEPGLPDAALHHAPLAFDELQFGQAQQIPDIANTKQELTPAPSEDIRRLIAFNNDIVDIPIQ
jgi:hypothetical protein